MFNNDNKGRGIIPKIIFGHMASPLLLMHVDYRVFKKIPGERKEIKAKKKENKDARIIHYGSPEEAKKFLNIPIFQIVPPIPKYVF